ncbi:MAG: hypothetical protein JWP12_2035 [Bacteroidetes bacterium]|nr:hypothetical protein [Bacteroidota bacterium]
MNRITILITLLIALFTGSLSAKTEVETLPDVDNSIVIDRISNQDVIVSIPSPIFSFKDVEVKLIFKNPNHTKLLLNRNRIEFIINGENKILDFVNGEASFKHRFDTSKILSIYVEDFSYNKSVTVYPLWAIITPMVIIVLYILRRLFKK